MIEDAGTFEVWLEQCIRDSKSQLRMSDRSLAYILLREGTKYYLRQITKEEMEKDV